MFFKDQVIPFKRFKRKSNTSRLKLILSTKNSVLQLKIKKQKKVILSDTWEVIIFKEKVTCGDACAGRWSYKNTDFEACLKNEGLHIKAKKLSTTNPSQDSILC